MYRLFITIFLFITTFYETSTQSGFWWPSTPMRYVDNESGYTDLFFDRIVFPILAIRNYTGDGRLQKIYSSGVLINEDQVLTTYNPFRFIINSKEFLSKTVVCYLLKRRVMIPYRINYNSKCLLTICGRPIIPMDDDDLTDDQWHGPDKKHAPVHDLMVMRLEEPVDIWEPPKPYTYEIEFSEANRINASFRKAGPSVTKLATENDIIQNSVKIAGLGLSTAHRARIFSVLEAAYYEYDDVKIDCDSWLPRVWGHFICIKNSFTAGFGSGALLFSNDLLFGIGSFTMWRKNESILAFTDIRLYNDLINNTCSANDTQF